MPYIFIWGSFALKGLDISRITNGTIEKYWATRKGFVTSAKLPADYLISVTDILIGQTNKLLLSSAKANDSSDEDEKSDEKNEEKASNSSDKYDRMLFIANLFGIFDSFIFLLDGARENWSQLIC